MRMTRKRLSNEATKKNAVGYCLYRQHEGNLNRRTVKRHHCIEKNCPFLIKYEDNDFWKESNE